jgi:hypothetical protein
VVISGGATPRRKNNQQHRREQRLGVFARLNAAINAFGGTFVEAHAPDDKTAKKIRKRMIGRTLTRDEAAARLDELSLRGAKARSRRISPFGRVVVIFYQKICDLRLHATSTGRLP